MTPALNLFCVIANKVQPIVEGFEKLGALGTICNLQSLAGLPCSITGLPLGTHLEAPSPLATGELMKGWKPKFTAKQHLVVLRTNQLALK